MTRISYACATLFTLTALLCSCGRGVSDPAPLADPCRVAKPFDTRSYRELAGVDPNLLRLDIRGFEPPPSGCDAAPVVIYVHGGGWAIGDKANVDSKDTYFASLGYVFVSINYRLSPHPPPFFLVKRGSANRRALVDAFRDRLHGARIPETTVDASGMTHSEVNDVIGTSSDHIITPAPTGFFGGCLK